MIIRKVCKECGSEEVRMDAFAEWSVENQSWELHSVYDNSWCADCDGETIIEDKADSCAFARARQGGQSGVEF